jgi:hypothetical protein
VYESIDPTTVDQDLLARWLAISALLASAQDLQARGGGPWPPLALVAADTANEAILGTIATALGRPPDKDATFDQIYHLAVEALVPTARPLTQSLRTRVPEMHRQRNTAVHLSVDPGPKAIARALETADDLRSHAVDALALLEAFRSSGPVRAVASKIGLEPIASALIEAEQFLAAGRLQDAADQCSIALGTALERVRPGLRSYKHVSGLDPNKERHLWFAVQRADENARLHEAWILALGLGLRPVELARLQRVLGVPVFDGPRFVEVEHDEAVELTEPIVTWAVRLTTDIIFRLWQGESLAARPWPYLDEGE